MKTPQHLLAAIFERDWCNDNPFNSLTINEREAVGQFDHWVFFAREDFFVGAFAQPVPFFFHRLRDNLCLDLADEGEVDINVAF